LPVKDTKIGRQAGSPDELGFKVDMVIVLISDERRVGRASEQSEVRDLTDFLDQLIQKPEQGWDSKVVGLAPEGWQ
jgi:hypothetical protein